MVKELNPTWISEGNDEVEFLTIQINLEGLSIRCVNGYGPQENDQNEKKQKFWSSLDNEVEQANFEEYGFILQMDGNLWAGPHIIPGDPNPRNKNGELFNQFLKRHPHLTVVNSLDICHGLITRRRNTTQKN